MALAKTRYTPEQYLALERAAEHKSEYANGQIYAMSGASEEHNLIVGNILAAIHAQFRGRPCRVYTSDMRVKISASGTYTYPDVVALCAMPSFEDAQTDTLTNPTVIVEVLSPSTEAYDRGAKFAYYRKLDSLSDYILVSQDRVSVEHFARQRDESGQWLLTETSDMSERLTITSIGCQMTLRDIYENVDLPGSIDNTTAEGRSWPTM